MTRLIKRYGNRKMYDTHASRYVTLDGVAELVRSGDDLRIIDNDSGEDLTAVTFAQIIFEEEKRENGLLGLPALRWIIQQGGEALRDLLSSVDRGREALGNVRELAEKRMKELTHPPAAPAASARRHRPGGRGLLNEILELPQKQLEQLQQRIDVQVRASLERVAGHPAFQNELRRIERSIKGLERQLGRLRRHQRGSVKPRRSKVSPARKGVEP
jgi:polyhydroxyalkanoate synthesis repressor PhaR